MSISVVAMRLGEAPTGSPVVTQVEVAASMDLGAAARVRIAAPMDLFVAIRAGAAAGSGFLTR
jgi:hypothetical protein